MDLQKKNTNFFSILSGSLLIAGTAVGAGMLAIPSVTGVAGFWPAFCITAAVGIYMLLTGLLFLEATLWMKRGANILSIAKSLIGKKARLLAGATFVFLYYCLMVAYFAAGAPIFSSVLQSLFGFSLTGWVSYAIFGLIFGLIVAMGLSFIDRVNYLLMAGLIISYVLLIGVGSTEVDVQKLSFTNWNKIFLAAPVLFSAFGYHNVIPSLTDHFKGSAKIMRWSIVGGTFLPFIIYLLWQWLIIGSVSQEYLSQSLSSGDAIVLAMSKILKSSWVPRLATLFGFFAIVTSMIGVSFSIVDFLGDGLKMKREGISRFFLCLLTFVPPFIITILDPSIFLLAIGIAGGFGEAFLNGILPVWLVWRGRYHKKLPSEYALKGGKITLFVLLLIGVVVMALEAVILL